MNVTFVIPVFNEEDTLAQLVERIEEHVGTTGYRILFVDDGSTDSSWAKLCKVQEQHRAVDLIRLDQNHGKTVALDIAFGEVKSDVVITMDADLQDEPAEIPRMLEKLEEGYDVVCGWKQERKDPWHKTLPSRLYNGLIARQFRLQLHDVNSGFKAIRGEVVKRIKLRADWHRLIPVLAAAMGYRVTEIPVTHHPRRFGKSKYGITRFYYGILDTLTIGFLARHENTVLRSLYIRAGFTLTALPCGIAHLVFAMVHPFTPMASCFLFLGLLLLAVFGFSMRVFWEIFRSHNDNPYNRQFIDEIRFRTDSEQAHQT